MSFRNLLVGGCVSLAFAACVSDPATDPAEGLPGDDGPADAASSGDAPRRSESATDAAAAAAEAGQAAQTDVGAKETAGAQAASVTARSDPEAEAAAERARRRAAARAAVANLVPQSEADRLTLAQISPGDDDAAEDASPAADTERDRPAGPAPSREARPQTQDPLRETETDERPAVPSPVSARTETLPPTSSPADALTLARAGVTGIERLRTGTPEATDLSRPLPTRRPSAEANPSTAAGAAPSTSMAALAAQESAAFTALALINAERSAEGLRPLEYSRELSAVARAHVVGLAARGEVSSLDPEGNGIGIRLSDAGFTPRVAGSLVAGGYTSFERALQTWLENDVQRSRLLLPDAEELGIAAISDRRSTYGTYIEAIIAGD